MSEIPVHGDVPTVSPADVRNVCELFHDVQAQTGSSCAIDVRVFEDICSPGADVKSVWYRASMLSMLAKMIPEVLASWTHDGHLDDAVFGVAAIFPMQKMKTGVVREGPTFDVEEFVKQIGART